MRQNRPHWIHLPPKFGGKNSQKNILETPLPELDLFSEKKNPSPSQCHPVHLQRSAFVQRLRNGWLCFCSRKAHEGGGIETFQNPGRKDIRYIYDNTREIPS